MWTSFENFERFLQIEEKLVEVYSGLFYSNISTKIEDNNFKRVLNFAQFVVDWIILIKLNNNNSQYK